MAPIWYGESVRLTLFNRQASKPDSTSGFWEAFVGAPPDRDELERPTGIRQQLGTVSDGLTLHLKAEPGRVDWTLSNPAPPGDQPSQPAVALIKSGIDMLEKWLPAAPSPFVRLALGVVMTSEVEDRPKGYALMREVAPTIQFDVTEDLRDFSYQINRRRPSAAIQGLIINRLMKWSVMQLVSGPMTLTEKGMIGTGQTSRYFGRVELDINTVPDPSGNLEFDIPQSIAIFRELEAMASAIAENGELA